MATEIQLLSVSSIKKIINAKKIKLGKSRKCNLAVKREITKAKVIERRGIVAVG